MDVRKPYGMEDLRRLTERVAGDLEDARKALRVATETTPQDAATTTAMLNGKLPRERRVRVDRIAGPIDSALCALDVALRQAAEAADTVYAEAKRVGVPDGATW